MPDAYPLAAMGTLPAASNPARDRLVRTRANKDDDKAVAQIETQVDLESAKLWNLSAFDLAEIQRSLKELTE
jgi:hypothetical protein